MPFLPRALYLELLHLQRDVREGRLVRVAERPLPLIDGINDKPGVWLTPPVASPPPQPDDDPDPFTLPDALLKASVAYAHGDAQQVATNRKLAFEMLGDGHDIDVILKRLRDGDEL